MPHLVHPVTSVKKLKDLIIKSADGILPFTEAPAINRENDEEKKAGCTGALELFSLFTADIIRAKTLFVR